MTYCVGLLVDQGIVLASDSRANAGVDDVSTFCKMRRFEAPGDRWIGVVCSGHLGITQAVFAELDEQAAAPMERRTQPSWRDASTMREVANLVGLALRRARADQAQVQSMGVMMASSFIGAGQIGSQPPGLFMIYDQGNFIEAQDGTRFFQIGEAKYGKPMLDRVVDAKIGLDDAAKCVLVSFDATLRSNLSVGAPIDLACYSAWTLAPAMTWRFGENDPYFESLRASWGASLRQAFLGLPAPPR